MKLKPLLEELLPGAPKKEDRKLKRKITALRLLSGKKKTEEMQKILDEINRVRRADGKPELSEKGFKHEVTLILPWKWHMQPGEKYKLGDDLKRKIDAVIEKNKNKSTEDIAGAIGALRRLVEIKHGDENFDNFNKYANDKANEIKKQSLFQQRTFW